MAIQTIKINSWEKFITDFSKKPYKRFIYRGHKKKNYHLETSIQRAFQDLGIQLRWRLGREKSIIKTFISTAHVYLSHLSDSKEFLEWLPLMQHFGAPTRLLDWTFSPFIAAFFSMENLNSECCIFEIDIKAMERANNKKGLTKFQLDAMTFGEGSPIIKDNIVYPFMPKLHNERLIAQQGIFLVPTTIQFGIGKILLYSDDYNKIIKKYVFNLKPHMMKNAIKSLKSMNIYYSNLFPGMEGLSKSLKFQLLESISSEPTALADLLNSIPVKKQLIQKLESRI